MDSVTDRHEQTNLKKNLHYENVISIKKIGFPCKRNCGIPLNQRNAISIKENGSLRGCNCEISIPKGQQRSRSDRSATEGKPHCIVLPRFSPYRGHVVELLITVPPLP